MTQFQKIESDIIINTNTKIKAIEQLVEGGYCTTKNKASKLYYRVRREK